MQLGRTRLTPGKRQCRLGSWVLRLLWLGGPLPRQVFRHSLQGMLISQKGGTGEPFLHSLNSIKPHSGPRYATLVTRHFAHSGSKVFSKDRALSLPPHRPYDCAIDLLPSAPLPVKKLYNLSKPGK